MSWFSIMLGTLSMKGPKQCSVWQRWCVKPTDVLPPFIVYNAQGTLSKESRYAVHNLHHDLEILAAQYKGTKRGNLNVFFFFSYPRHLKQKSGKLSIHMTANCNHLCTVEKYEETKVKNENEVTGCLQDSCSHVYARCKTGSVSSHIAYSKCLYALLDSKTSFWIGWHTFWSFLVSTVGMRLPLHVCALESWSHSSSSLLAFSKDCLLVFWNGVAMCI